MRMMIYFHFLSFFLVVQQYGLYEFSFLNDFIVRGQWPQELHNQ